MKLKAPNPGHSPFVYDLSFLITQPSMVLPKGEGFAAYMDKSVAPKGTDYSDGAWYGMIASRSTGRFTFRMYGNASDRGERILEEVDKLSGRNDSRDASYVISENNDFDGMLVRLMDPKSFVAKDGHDQRFVNVELKPMFDRGPNVIVAVPVWPWWIEKNEDHESLGREILAEQARMKKHPPLKLV